MPITFHVLLFFIAALYAMVGHGGASGYLALMVVFNVAPESMKPTALVLNIAVSAVAFSRFYREKHFNWALFWPLAILAIPMAYCGGLFPMNGFWVKKVLGIILLFAAVRLLLYKDQPDGSRVQPHRLYAVLIGAGIGFLSGLLGIGGGILLSPLLLRLRWANQKQTAAISALFIFVNSIAGLLGQLKQGVILQAEMPLLASIATVGGLLGAWFGAARIRQDYLRFVLSVVLLIAVYKLFNT